MDLQDLKQRLTPINIGESITPVVMRYPMAVLFLTTLTAMLSYVIFFLCNFVEQNEN